MKRSTSVIGIVSACVVLMASCAAGTAVMKAAGAATSQAPQAAPPLTLSATATPTSSATPTSAAPLGWTTILDDQFNTPGLPAQWTLYNGSFGDSAHNCAAPSQVQVPGDGYLHLKMQYRTTGVCGAGWYTGGMQVDPAYGGVDQAITVRWRIVPSADPGIVYSHRIIPMRWVDDPQYAWYQGESNYCEGGHVGGCYTYLHYGANSRQIAHGYTVDLTQWHTWRVEVRNHQVSVFIDNMTTPVWVYHGNSATTPDSFKRTVLQQECSLGGCPSRAYADDVEDIQIDWITIQNATNEKVTSKLGYSGLGQAPTAQVAQTAGCSGAVAGICLNLVAAARMAVRAFTSDVAKVMRSPLRRFIQANWTFAEPGVARAWSAIFLSKMAQFKRWQAQA